MIYVTGDLHGEIGIEKFSFKNFPEGKTLTKKDYIIILGDFGLLWQECKTERYWTKWLTEKPWTTLFICGNHENFDRINALPEMEMFDGKVGFVTNSIYHLKRGEIYNINGNDFFVMGGANSIDKEHRVVGLSWWPEEIPNYAETNYALKNLLKHDREVDYILTHTCPERIFQLMDSNYLFKMANDNDSTRTFLDYVDNTTKFKKWYFGHFHENAIFEDKYIMIYNDIIKLDKNIEKYYNKQ